jgi:zinc protease
MLTALTRETTSPNEIGSRLWWRTAFPNHPYSLPTNGTLDSVPTIAREDLTGYVGRVLARDNLKIGVVGDIDAKTLGTVLDQVFGALPEKAQLRPVPHVRPESVGKRLEVQLDVPQTVVAFGGSGIPRKDPDFIPAFIVNHILGGGSFTSRLYSEVREKRGLAYSVYSYLLPLDAAALFMGGTQTRADKANEAVGLIEAEIKRLAEQGPTSDELEKSKSYLKGSYALGFDTSTKIAGQLVQLQVDDLGIDYWDRRNGLIDAVTLEDVKRVADRLLNGGVLFTVVGRTQTSATAKQGG